MAPTKRNTQYDILIQEMKELKEKMNDIDRSTGRTETQMMSIRFDLKEYVSLFAQLKTTLRDIEDLKSQLVQKTLGQ